MKKKEREGEKKQKGEKKKEENKEKKKREGEGDEEEEDKDEKKACDSNTANYYFATGFGIPSGLSPAYPKHHHYLRYKLPTC